MTLGKQCQHSREEGRASWSGVPDLGLSHLTGPVLVLVLLCVSVAWFYYVALTGLRLLIFSCFSLLIAGLQVYSNVPGFALLWHIDVLLCSAHVSFFFFVNE